MTKSIYLPEQLVDKIKKEAEKQQRSFSWTLANLVEKYFQKKESSDLIKATEAIDILEGVLTEVKSKNVGNKTINSITTYIYNIFKCEVNKQESEVEK